MTEKVLVAGAGGYVGSRLVRRLLELGKEVVAVSSRPVDRWTHRCTGAEALSLDLREYGACQRAVFGVDKVYNLAASVGGIGFVESNYATCLVNSLINTNLLRASALEGVSRYFFASSSCVYPSGIDCPLRESDAHPASPMGGYGWEKLFSEQVCLAFEKERVLPVTIARYHGIYGPGDTREEGKDHVVTALAKVFAKAKRAGDKTVRIWGDGLQTRSLLYIDDCVEGTLRLMDAEIKGPVNLAHPTPVSVNDILLALEEVSAFHPQRFYDLSAPRGRQHKVSDNMKLRGALGWEPSTDLISGIRATYNACWDEVIRA